MELTKRERTIAARYAAGDTHRQIAAALHISPATVRNHVAAIYRKLGVQNKPELIREMSGRTTEFGVLPPTRSGTRTEPALANLRLAHPSKSSLPSIAVLSFETIGDPMRDHLGHGIAADIQHDLTRCHDLLVAGRSSSLALGAVLENPVDAAARLGVDYLLQGTIRTEGDGVRMTAEMVDGGTGLVLWSERHDARASEIFSLEAAVALAVVRNLSLEIGEAHFAGRRVLDADALTGYDWRLRGNRLLELGGRENLVSAREAFENALACEPGSAPALAGLSMSWGYECDLLLAEDYERSLARHTALAEQAIAADEFDSRSHYALSCALMLEGEFERADEHARRGVDLNPSEYHNLCNRGYSLLSLGLLDESVRSFSQSLRRNPLAPNSCLLAIGIIEYLDANYGNSASVLSEMNGYHVQRAATMAAACASVGYEETARSAVEEFEHVIEEVPSRPRGSSSDGWPQFWRRAYPYINDESLEHILEGLGRAGLPT